MREPVVSVGIVNAVELRVCFNGDYTCETMPASGPQVIRYRNGLVEWKGTLHNELLFTPADGANDSFALEEVTIGIGFHWERKETQLFRGQLRIIVDKGKLQTINILPVEEYLKSVISSEMSATASLQLLKAHAVISRGWLLAQINKRKGTNTNHQTSYYRTDKGIIRWYDREDHTLFDVCADDHCQRYQGITRQTNDKVRQAVDETCGQVLTYNGQICDTRFSKCCGGVMEEYEACWEDNHIPYLMALPDTADDSLPIPDLTIEENAREWIMQSQWPSFCNTTDKRILSQVLNNYDQETTDFYRWKVEYTQQELSQLVNTKLAMDLGRIIALHPIRRGKSGRIIELEIVGEKQSFTIGKELEIRRTLSTTHLFSSAFVTEYVYGDDSKIPERFILHGAGWGHGVGLCQIGAAVMGNSGYDYKAILLHYYPGTSLSTICHNP